MASSATRRATDSGSGARPRLVWITTPVALITRTSEGAVAEARRDAHLSREPGHALRAAAGRPRVGQHRPRLRRHQRAAEPLLERAHRRLLQELVDGGERAARVAFARVVHAGSA